MFNIHTVLSSIDEKSRTTFSRQRAHLRACYMATLNSFGGSAVYDETDDWFLDAIDQRIAFLMQRAGHTVPVILPTSEAIASTLPRKSIETITKTDPTKDGAGDVPQDELGEGMKALVEATRARAATAPVQPPAQPAGYVAGGIAARAAEAAGKPAGDDVTTKD